MSSIRHGANPKGLLTTKPLPTTSHALHARSHLVRPYHRAAAAATAATAAPNAWIVRNGLRRARSVAAHYGKQGSDSYASDGNGYRTTMQLPEDLHALAVVGKGHVNQAWLRRESGGGRVEAAKGDPRLLLLRAPTAQALDRLQQLVSAQVEAAVKLGSLPYPHPEGVYYVLEEGEHGFGAAERVVFVGRDDEVTRASQAKGPVSVLGPAALGSQYYGGAASNSEDFFPSGRMGAPARALSTAVHRAVGPLCAKLEMQVNLGKQLFYQVPQHMLGSTGLHLSELQVGSSTRRRAFRSVYSNWVTKRQVDALVGWLQSRHGFVRQGGEAGAHHRVKVYVINRRLNVKYGIGLARESLDDRAPVLLRGISPAIQRCCFVSIMGGPVQPDLRLKLQATGHPMQDRTAQAVAEALVAGCNSYGLARAVMAGGALPPDMELDAARAVTEHVYEGAYQVPGGGSLPLRVAVSLIEDSGSGTRYGRHYEVEATLPLEQQALGALLASGQGATAAGGAGQACGAEWAEGVLRGLVGLRAELGGSELLLP